MECPVCFETKTVTRFITLECKHQLCQTCAKSWLLTQSCTCPLCRSQTHFFSRNTRSRQKKERVLCEMDTMVFILETFSQRQIDVHVMLLLLEMYILGEPSVWYRADMKITLRSLQKKLSILKDPTVYDLSTLTAHEHLVLEQILSL